MPPPEDIFTPRAPTSKMASPSRRPQPRLPPSRGGARSQYSITASRCCGPRRAACGQDSLAVTLLSLAEDQASSTQGCLPTRHNRANALTQDILRERVEDNPRVWAQDVVGAGRGKTEGGCSLYRALVRSARHL